ncbi:MAG: tetratricopeptide repeat protein [Ignavibacteriae bacterium]|nr:tetratricopeptide repeat protein [Ignavibacteria bacterium]MBI3363790.1 tetratricopeptide repeat protein [Ignavibacteriota bacterium]
MIALEENHILSADSLFGAALRLDSSCAEAYIGKAQLFRQQGQWAAGERELYRAVERAPTSIFAREELVGVLLHGAEKPLTKERSEAALPHLQTIVRLDSNNRQAHYDLAQANEFLQRWNDAIMHYREVLRIGELPEDMDVWLYTVHQDIARCLEANGDNPAAAAEMALYLHSLEEFGADDQTIQQVKSKIKELGHKQ